MCHHCPAPSARIKGLFLHHPAQNVFLKTQPPGVVIYEPQSIAAEMEGPGCSVVGNYGYTGPVFLPSLALLLVHIFENNFEF